MFWFKLPLSQVKCLPTLSAGELSPRHEAGAMHGKKVPVPNYVRQEATGGYSRILYGTHGTAMEGSWRERSAKLSDTWIPNVIQHN
ncbi:hypothetical protein Y1Q_0018010 [Alligator mississippiensis]|uniref:Uncharacterized protein n=1 Tax=Alligator mississippiensis TaxID=8496 RepID=A0A151MXW0_ALLMI|nr:hypothetical protein Y1Q_0018010 [Alligator mississippiensis]